MVKQRNSINEALCAILPIWNYVKNTETLTVCMMDCEPSLIVVNEIVKLQNKPY
jgi:hypothetical protein